MPSNLPSSYGPAPSQQQGAALPKIAGYAPQQPEARQPPAPRSDYSNNLPMIMAAIALVLSLACAYGVFFMDRPLSPAQKAELKGIAEDLRSLTQRDITMTAPVQTTIMLDKSYPLRELFPSSFEIPLEFNLPIDTNLLAIGPNGQPFSARIRENVPIKVSVPINSETAFGEETIALKKEMPVDATFTSSVKIGNTYKQEMDSIIGKLDNLAK